MISTKKMSKYSTELSKAMHYLSKNDRTVFLGQAVSVPGTIISSTLNDVSISSSAGVLLYGDGDGALSFQGLGNGFDENFTLNFDDTSNTIVGTTTTGVTNLDFSGIDRRVALRTVNKGGDNDDEI